MENEVIEYWIWLQQALGFNSPKVEKLLDFFGGIDGIYKAKNVDYLGAGFLSEKEITKLCDKSLDKSSAIVGVCMEKGYTILSYNNMPSRLRNIYAPPCVLYVSGELPESETGIFIAMVGTRNVTNYGVEAATKLSLGLSACGAVVVSGLAVGVDTASHKGALRGGGKTVAVVGCGLDIDYPAQNKELRRLISQNGAIVSEYPPGTRPSRLTFPIRNRIIAGLSLGCVVVEAGSRSGSLITASMATEMGRDVFAVPGSIFSPYSDGTNRLLKDGAKPVLSVTDILEEYIGVCQDNIIEKMSDYGKREKITADEQLTFDTVTKTETVSENKEHVHKAAKKPAIINNTETPPREHKRHIPQGLSETQALVYNVLTTEPMHVDDISLRANVELRKVLAVLTTFEIEGYIRSFPGKRYSLL